MRPLTFLLTALLTGCGSLVRSPAEVARAAHQAVPAADLDRAIPAEDIRADVAFALATLSAVHPDPYARADSAAVAQAAARVTEPGEPMTRLGLWRALAPVLATLGDAHTSLGWPAEEWARFRRGGGTTVEIPISVEGDGLVVADAPGRGGLPAGATLDSLGGEPATAVLARLRRTVSAESVTYADHRIERLLGPYLWLVDGTTGPVEVVADGVSFTIDGVTADSLRARTGSDATERALVYQRLPDGTGWLRATSFSPRLADYQRDLEATFAQIRDDGIARLVVDVRDNGGGNSALADALLSYLTDRPYRLLSRAEWRRSREYGAYMKQHAAPAIRWLPVWGLHPATRGYFRTPVGQTYAAEVDVQTPEPRALRFAGDWAVVAGPRTFSSATLFVVAVKDHGLAPVVGQETGGQATGFGEVYAVDLPHSRLVLRVSTKRFVRPSGSTAPGGVEPDVRAETRRDGRTDPALEAAVRRLGGS